MIAVRRHAATASRCGTIVRREVTRILRIWGQTLVPPAITMTLYFLIFGGLIGSRIGEMDGFTLHGLHRARAW